MPPVRRARRARPAAASPYLTDGGLSRRRRRTVSVGNMRRAVEDKLGSDGGAPTPATLVPDDVLFAIFTRASGAADVARCAATCRRWGGVVAARAAAICRALPAPAPPAAFIPHLALGVLFPQRKTARKAAQLRFVPTAASANSSPRHLEGLSAGGGPALDLDFDHARPVVSRNGRVVLELRRAGGLTLCVWNPATGAVSVLPPLSGKDYPGGGDYACAMLTSEDVAGGPLASSPGFFRVLVVYERRHRSSSFTALRCYSSDTGSWGAEAKKPGDKISGRVLRQLGPAVVLRGVAYWPTHHAALGVRLDGTSAAMDVCSVPYTLTHCELDEHVLGVSPDGRGLRFVGTGFVARRTLVICFLASQLRGVVGCTSVDQSDDDDGGDDIKIFVPQIEVARTTAVKLRWFGEKSGTLILTVGETGSGTSDVFAFNLATRSVDKLAGGVCNHACSNLCGYEMIAQHSLRP